MRANKNCLIGLIVLTLLTACGKSEPQASSNMLPAEKSGDGKVLIHIEPLAEKTLDGRSHGVQYIVSNGTKERQRLLTWKLATQGVWDDLFEVRDESGRELPYVGPIAKRGAPTEEDFLNLPPGENRGVLVDVSEYYDMSAPGTYTIKLRRVPIEDVSELGPLAEKREPPIEFDEKELPAVTAGPEAIHAPRAMAAAKAGEGGYSNCSDKDIDDLKSAQTNAQAMSGKANADLASHSAGSTSSKYNEWFGAATSPRYSRVTSNFGAIDRVVNGSMSFQCKPERCSSQSVFAYVFPADRTHVVHLCAAFWRAGQSGWDSKPGTLIHEVSHFDDVAGTRDLGYGTTRARDLAKSKPDDAIRNADNHEYFSESQ